ncbi:SH2 domain-containing protein 4A [Cololabis saira]|uniref:SH2 domain-containing protein 4A n=1 Tax=Cololabis saira TaxID=129043 RepID=UPI002AD3671D|nr:SH2 domain-containing protein 4A [Cololabis saira]
MLQQILKDMYIEPDVLEALNEDQKKTLFLKMRQEQVRRWKEREEKLDREGGEHDFRRPKKANSKNVSWLLGRDGDVAVIVIGEVDELTSRFICTGFGEKKSQSLQSSTYHESIMKKSKKPTEDVRTERENLPPKTQPGISLNMKTDSKSGGAAEKSVPHPSVCSRPPMRVSPINVRPASSSATVGCVSSRPGPTNPRLDATAPSASTSGADSGSAPQSKGGPCAREPQTPRETQGGKDVAAPGLRRAASEDAGTSGTAPVSAGRGRVAQLMKTFSVDSPTQTPPRGVKPPLPTKPCHLRLTTTPTVR